MEKRRSAEPKGVVAAGLPLCSGGPSTMVVKGSHDRVCSAENVLAMRRTGEDKEGNGRARTDKMEGSGERGLQWCVGPAIILNW